MKETMLINQEVVERNYNQDVITSGGLIVLS